MVLLGTHGNITRLTGRRYYRVALIARRRFVNGMTVRKLLGS